MCECLENNNKTIWMCVEKQDVPDERGGVKQQPIVSHKPSRETERGVKS